MPTRIILILLLALSGTTAAAQSLRLMTYNVRYDNPNDGLNAWPNRKAWVGAQIRFYEPDVLGTQEVEHHMVQQLDSLLPGYAYLGVGRADGKTGGEYSAIFYREDRFAVQQQSTFWLSETPDRVSVGWDASMERICTYAQFEDRQSGERFWVFNAHFDHIGKQARANSLRLIDQKIETLTAPGDKVFFMGDLNIPASEPVIQDWQTELEDTYHLAGSRAYGPEGTWASFDITQPLERRIDYIFTRQNVEVHKHGTIVEVREQRYPSDHLPVLVEVTFN